MTPSNDNAVEYYRHLRQQDVAPSKALEHAAQRFGIPVAILRERVNGRVADHDATVDALAEARTFLTGGPTYSATPESILRSLYIAITGERP